MSAIPEKANSPTFINFDEVGLSMEEIACDVVKTEKNKVISKWYKSSKDINLYVWEDAKNNVIKQQMNICGQVIEWNIIEGVKTGCICDVVHGVDAVESSPADISLKENIIYDNSPLVTSISQAEKILKKMEILEIKYRQGLIHNFVEAPSADQMDPKHFLKVYGHNLYGAKRSFWSRFFGWFQEFSKRV